MMSKDWSKAIIITRDCVNTSWELVSKTLGKAVQRKIEVFPFQANKAVWWPHNEEDALFYLRLKKCYLENKVTLSFQRWSHNSNSEEEVFECCHSWIRLLGIPWDLWSKDLFKSIGDQCGGLLNISQDTVLLRDLSAAKIKVVGVEGGFINRNLQITTKRGPLIIRIIVDSVKISEYDMYEKRSYAQVVINGATVVTGWGNKKGFKENVSNAENMKDIQIRQEDNITSHSVENQEGMVSHDQNCEPPNMCKFKETNGFMIAEKDENPGERSCVSEPWQRGKNIKILKKLKPKDENEFQKGKIESTNILDTQNNGHQDLEEEYCPVERKFEHVYRRKQVKSHQESYHLQKKETSKISIIEIDKDTSHGEDGIWEEQLYHGARDDTSDDGGAFSDADSHISNHSDKSTRKSVDFDDLGEFFEESPSKVCNLPNNSNSHHSPFHSLSVSVSFFGSGRGVEVMGEREIDSLGKKVGITGNNFTGHHEGMVEGEKIDGLGKQESNYTDKNECLRLMGVEKVEFKDLEECGMMTKSEVVRCCKNKREAEVNQ
ncbi:uncharacterized protein LOC142505596 isoform X1 [Primulina tabacum]|uniref:uncharacterized protein LOC142505596 isoform X1 n=1 Tax=Primulina tabacum TaxID=48773 RepID=UPI003F5A4E78